MENNGNVNKYTGGDVCSADKNPNKDGKKESSNV